MMSNCREVTRALASDELESAGVWKWLSIRLHLLMCIHCSKYARQLAAIGNAARSLFEPTHDGDPGLEGIEKLLASRLSKTSTEETTGAPEPR